MSESPNVRTGPARETGPTAEQKGQPTAERAKEAAGGVAGSAKEQARHVADDAREQMRTVAGQLRERTAREAESQAKKTADGMRRWADELTDMANTAREGSPMRDLVMQAARQSRRAADTLEERGFGGMVEGLESFARRRPGTFLVGSALAGIIAGRAAKTGRGQHHRPDGSGTVRRLSPAEDVPAAPPGTPPGTSVPGTPPYGGPAGGDTGLYGGSEAPRRPGVS